MESKLIKIKHIRKMEDESVIQNYYYVEIFSLNGTHRVDQFEIPATHLEELKKLLNNIK